MYYIGIDIGGTGIKAGVVKENGEIICKSSIPTEAGAHYSVLAKHIADLTLAVIKEAGISMDEVKSIGMGSPGSIDDKNGVVLYANNLNLLDAPLCAEVAKHIDKPVYIGNDANCAALGEFFALEDESITDFIAVTLGTGVGGGIVIDGKLFTGSNGVAGELGHMVTVVDGEDCSCGRKGCWEAYASATALIRDAERAAKLNPDSLVAKMIAENGGKANGKIVWDAKDAGDSVAQAVIDKYIQHIAEGIVNLINIFQPQVIAIGGGVSVQGDNLLSPVKAQVADRCYGNLKIADIVMAKLGNDAGIVGAAFLGK